MLHLGRTAVRRFHVADEPEHLTEGAAAITSKLGVGAGEMTATSRRLGVDKGRFGTPNGGPMTLMREWLVPSAGPVRIQLHAFRVTEPPDERSRVLEGLLLDGFHGDDRTQRPLMLEVAAMLGTCTLAEEPPSKEDRNGGGMQEPSA
jgi:hypothetical protein